MHPRLEITEGTQELRQERTSPPRGARQLSTVGWQRPPPQPWTLPCHTQVGALTVLDSHSIDLEPAQPVPQLSLKPFPFSP